MTRLRARASLSLRALFLFFLFRERCQFSVTWISIFASIFGRCLAVEFAQVHPRSPARHRGKRQQCRVLPAHTGHPEHRPFHKSNRDQTLGESKALRQIGLVWPRVWELRFTRRHDDSDQRPWARTRAATTTLDSVCTQLVSAI